MQDSRECLGKHIDTIWEVKWENRDKGSSESLYSIAADGLIKEWNMKKGLEF